MLSQSTRLTRHRRSRLSDAAHRLVRHSRLPACPTVVSGTLADRPRGRAEWLAANAGWRQPWLALHRRLKTPRLTWRERWSLLFLARGVPHGQPGLPIIRPEPL